MHAAGNDNDAVRLRGLIVVLWRAGLRISEALALNESDLDLNRGAILIRRGKGGKRREVGMDRWAWQQLDPWLQLRAMLPVGALFCVLRGPTRGRPWSPAGVRAQLHHVAARAGVRRRFAPHQPRHAHAVEMSREGVPLLVIQRQLGHADLAITSVYFARNRQHRDRPGRPRAPRPDDSGHPRPADVAVVLGGVVLGRPHHGRLFRSGPVGGLVGQRNVANSIVSSTTPPRAKAVARAGAAARLRLRLREWMSPRAMRPCELRCACGSAPGSRGARRRLLVPKRAGPSAGHMCVGRDLVVCVGEALDRCGELDISPKRSPRSADACG